MGKNIIIICVLISVIIFSCNEPDVHEYPENRIIIELEPYSNSQKSPLSFTVNKYPEISFIQINRVELGYPWKSIKSKVIDGKVKWVLYSEKPVCIKYDFGVLQIVNPKDSIVIFNKDSVFAYSGKGYEKCIIWDQMMQIEKEIKKPAVRSYLVKSIDDYLEWNKYVDIKLSRQIQFIDSCRKKISSFDYDYLRSFIVSSNENDRLDAFYALLKYNQKNYFSNLRLTDFDSIWDSTQNKTFRNWLQTVSNFYGSISELYFYDKLEVWRRFDFDTKRDSLKDKGIRTFLYYNNAKKRLAGVSKERLLAFILDEQTITEMGLNNPMAQALLKDYYSQPGFPEYKQYVKGLEEKAKKIAKN